MKNLLFDLGLLDYMRLLKKTIFSSKASYAISLFLTLLFFNYGHAEENKTMNQERQVLVVETTQGTFEVTLFNDIAPKAVENFTKLAEKKYYDGTTFHRIIQQFMIQGGDPLGNGTGGESIWGKSFEDEALDEKFDQPGLLAMANRGPNTNGSQFFITTVKTPWLNGKHTIFGKVTKGYDVVEKLESVATDSRDRPLEPQKILKISKKS